MRRFATVVALSTLLLALVAPTGATAATSPAAGGDTRVTVGSPSTQFPRNKQNEPAVSVAIDPRRIPTFWCPARTTRSTTRPVRPATAHSPRGRDNGVYFSLNGGHKRIRPATPAGEHGPARVRSARSVRCRGFSRGIRLRRRSVAGLRPAPGPLASRGRTALGCTTAA